MKVRELKKALEAPIAGVRQEVAGVRNKVADVRHELADIRNDAVELRLELVAVRQQLGSTRADLEHQVGEVKASLGEVKTSLERKIENLGTNLERQMTANLETGRRHMDVIAEDLRSLVRLGLDRQMATAQQIASLAASHATDHAAYDLAFQDHETRLRALESQDSSADQPE